MKRPYRHKPPRYGKNAMLQKKPIFFFSVEVDFQQAVPENVLAFTKIRLQLRQCNQQWRHDDKRHQKCKHQACQRFFGYFYFKKPPDKYYYFGNNKFAIREQYFSLFSWLINIITRKKLALKRIQQQHKWLRQIVNSVDKRSKVTTAPMKNRCVSFNGTGNTREAPQHSTFDSDSKEVLVDNGALHSLSPFRRDFITYKRLSKGSINVEALTGNTSPIGKGLVSYTVEDNNGITHTIESENYHVPHAPIRIFSPQEWCQNRRDACGNERAHCDTRWDRLVLEWTPDGLPSSQKVSKQKNVGFMSTSTGYTALSKFAFCFSAYQTYEDPLQLGRVPDPDGWSPDQDSAKPRTDLEKSQELERKDSSTEDIQLSSSVSSQNEAGAQLQSTDNAPATLVDNDNSPLLSKDERLFMEYQEQLGHLSWTQLKRRQRQGWERRR
jgi:hypothetical protein